MMPILQSKIIDQNGNKYFYYGARGLLKVIKVYITAQQTFTHSE